jgi:hypothetical protein
VLASSIASSYRSFERHTLQHHVQNAHHCLGDELDIADESLSTIFDNPVG